MQHRSRHTFSARRWIFVGFGVALLVSSGCGPRPKNGEREAVLSNDGMDPPEADAGLPLGPYSRDDALSEDVSMERAALLPEKPQPRNVPKLERATTSL